MAQASLRAQGGIPCFRTSVFRVQSPHLSGTFGSFRPDVCTVGRIIGVDFQGRVVVQGFRCCIFYQTLGIQ